MKLHNNTLVSLLHHFTEGALGVLKLFPDLRIHLILTRQGFRCFYDEGCKTFAFCHTCDLILIWFNLLYTFSQR